MFDLDRFIADCRAALAEGRGAQAAMREVTARAVADAGSLTAVIGEPVKAGTQKLYHAPDLTILNLAWGPGMTIYPHDHRMWAVIGIYSGREDNIFWRRLPDGTVEAAGAKSLGPRDCTILGKDIVHSVTNPLSRLTCALHVYGGDFFAAERSEWDPETLSEQPYDVVKAMKLFEDSNRRMVATS